MNCKVCGKSPMHCSCPEQTARPLDIMIGKLDRMLSEFLETCESKPGELDEADRQTLKHHADDLIGVGNAALERLGFKKT